jgi:hypothetical protein
VEGGAALAVVVREAGDVGVGNFGVAGRKRGGAAQQAEIGETGEQVADAGDFVVGGTEVLLVELGDANGTGTHLVGQVGERDELKYLVDEFDDGAVLGGLVGDAVSDTVGRDEDGGDAWPLVEREAGGVVGADAGADVVVEAVGLVVGDEDDGVRPVGAAGDGVDFAGEEGLGELRVGVAGVVVVAVEFGGETRVGIERLEAEDVAVSAADVEEGRARAATSAKKSPRPRIWALARGLSAM